MVRARRSRTIADRVFAELARFGTLRWLVARPGLERGERVQRAARARGGTGSTPAQPREPLGRADFAFGPVVALAVVVVVA